MFLLSLVSNQGLYVAFSSHISLVFFNLEPWPLKFFLFFMTLTFFFFKNLSHYIAEYPQFGFVYFLFQMEAKPLASLQ